MCETTNINKFFMTNINKYLQKQICAITKYQEARKFHLGQISVCQRWISLEKESSEKYHQKTWKFYRYLNVKTWKFNGNVIRKPGNWMRSQNFEIQLKCDEKTLKLNRNVIRKLGNSENLESQVLAVLLVERWEAWLSHQVVQLSCLYLIFRCDSISVLFPIAWMWCDAKKCFTEKHS